MKVPPSPFSTPIFPNREGRGLVARPEARSPLFFFFPFLPVFFFPWDQEKLKRDTALFFLFFLFFFCLFFSPSAPFRWRYYGLLYVAFPFLFLFFKGSAI